MLCAGSVRKKNVTNTMLKNLLDACGAALGFYSVGYAFAYGGSEDAGKKTFIGMSNFFLQDVDNYMFWLFQFAFAATSATIVAGTLAERCQMTAYLCYSIALTGFVYPVVAHSIWSQQGFLSATAQDPLWGTGFIDFAGSTVVHLTGGFTALIATYLLGPRRGRFYDAKGKQLEVPNPMPGHSAALQMLGCEYIYNVFVDTDFLCTHWNIIFSNCLRLSSLHFMVWLVWFHCWISDNYHRSESRQDHLYLCSEYDTLCSVIMLLCLTRQLRHCREAIGRRRIQSSRCNERMLEWIGSDNRWMRR